MTRTFNGTAFPSLHHVDVWMCGRGDEVLELEEVPVWVRVSEQASERRKSREAKGRGRKTEWMSRGEGIKEK